MLNENMRSAMGNLLEGDIVDIDIAAGTADVRFPDIYAAVNWRRTWNVPADLRDPLRSLDNPVTLRVRLSQPALLGYVNSGYVITDVITEPTVTGEDHYYVIGTRKEAGHSTRYVTWGCHYQSDDWTFYWGHYKETLSDARRDLAERSVLVPVE